jgi:hypothetical protein
VPEAARREESVAGDRLRVEDSSTCVHELILWAGPCLSFSYFVQAPIVAIWILLPCFQQLATGAPPPQLVGSFGLASASNVNMSSPGASATFMSNGLVISTPRLHRPSPIQHGFVSLLDLLRPGITYLLALCEEVGLFSLASSLQDWRSIHFSDYGLGSSDSSITCAPSDDSLEKS